MHVVEFALRNTDSKMEAFIPMFNKHAEILSNFTGEVPSLLSYYKQYASIKNKEDTKEFVATVEKYLGPQAAGIYKSDAKMRHIMRESAAVNLARDRVDKHQILPPEEYGSDNLLNDYWHTPESIVSTIEQITTRFLPPSVNGSENWDTPEGKYRIKAAIWAKLLATPRPWAYENEIRMPNPGKVNRVEYRYVPQTNSFVPRFDSSPVTDFTINNEDIWLNEGLEHVHERNAAYKLQNKEILGVVEKIKQKINTDPTTANLSSKEKQAKAIEEFEKYIGEYIRESDELLEKIPPEIAQRIPAEIFEND